MISYHRTKFVEGRSFGYSRGWLAVSEGNMVDRLAKCMENFVWSPIVWEGGHRLQTNFISADWMALDFECPDFSLDDAIDAFKDFTHVIGTTRNHQKLKDGVKIDRFRVVLMLDESITNLRVYRYNMTKVLNIFPADRACKDGGRLFYPCTEVVVVNQCGDTVQVLQDVPKKFEPIYDYSAYYEAGMMTPYVKKMLSPYTKIPLGNRNNSVYAVSFDLAKLGYTQEQSLDLILKSNIYGADPSDVPIDEIRATIKSAFKKGLA